MKSTFFSVLAFFLTFHVAVLSQNTEDKVVSCFSTGNADFLMQELSQEVECIFLDESGKFSADQSRSKLTEFFRKHPPIGYKTVHTGTSPNGSTYEIGQYESTTGLYRTNMLRAADNKLIIEIRIEKDE